MSALFQFFSEKNHNTLPRKLSISHPKTLIYGPPKSGKTSLAFDYANSSNLPYKKILYLDCLDSRLVLEEAKAELLKLYLEKKIELLILDSYQPNFPLPKITHTILISQTPQNLPEFHSLKLNNLTFLEYISFYQKQSSSQTLLKNFIKDGNLPQMPFCSEYQKITFKQEMAKLALGNDFELFCKLLCFQSQKLTTNQFYTFAKKTIKLSKDKSYAFFQELQNRGILFFLPHLSPTKPKKLYFYDFSLAKALIPQNPILSLLENMFVLELLSLVGENIYYDDFSFFHTPKGIFYFAPFAQEDFIHKKLSKVPPQGQKIRIITLDFSAEGITLQNTWEAYSFVEFALGDID